MPITYLKGDATRPVGEGPKAIIHVCNNVGGWGAGFVLAVSKRWKQPEAAYRAMKSRDLGAVQVVDVAPGLAVINMIAQVGYGNRGTSLHRTDDPAGQPPIRYEALEECLQLVAAYAKGQGASVHGPRFGAGLAGGKWEKIEPIILKTLGELPVFIYDLP